MFTVFQPYLLYIKFAAIAVAAALLFGAGWEVKGWKDDAGRARDAAVVQKAVDAFHDSESKVAGILEAKLAALRANKTIVERQIEKVVDRPVYRNVCLDDDGLRLIEQLRTGTAAPAIAASAVP